MDQNDIFIKSEGNNWFQRNREALTPERDDFITRMLQRLEIHPKNIVEVGCSNGWRLEKLRCIYSAECFGIEASEEAVTFARGSFPQIKVEQQDIARMSCEKTFDLAICNFVFHWLDRGHLLQAVAHLDALVNAGGYLVLGDFLPDFNQKRWYHHLPNKKVYTYKQDYPAIFLASGLYKEVIRETFSHDHKEKMTQYAPSNERAVISVLRKMLVDEYYPEM